MSNAPLSESTVTQIGIIVHDIEATMKLWSTLLGIPTSEIIITDTVDKAHTEYQNQSTPARAKLAFFNLGPITLELIEPIDAPSTWHDQLVQHGPSLHHIAFEVKGMSDCITTLAEQGIPLVQRGDYEGGRYAYVDGTQQLGTVIEVLEND